MAIYILRFKALQRKKFNSFDQRACGSPEDGFINDPQQFNGENTSEMPDIVFLLTRGTVEGFNLNCLSR